MDNEVISFVIVGHIDHGKSTLIGRLLHDTGSLTPDRYAEMRAASGNMGKETELAYLLDQLEEEREKCITIDTAQAEIRFNGRRYIMIDAPGHIDTMANMITGASQADAAVLVIDADEGVREQTKRHADILSLLKIRHVIVVINKMDIVNFSQRKFEAVKRETQAYLSEIGIEPLHCIPASAFKGDNVVANSKKMSWCGQSTVMNSLESVKINTENTDGKLLLPIQDVYQINGKRINVGKIISGTIESGNEYKAFPSGKKVRIKSIEILNEQKLRCFAGESIGVTIDDDVPLGRGDMICSADDEENLSNTISAHIIWLSDNELKENDRKMIQCATQETGCVISRIAKRINSSAFEIVEEDSKILRKSEAAKVTITTENPIVVRKFSEIKEMGRFILFQDDQICASGMVL